MKYIVIALGGSADKPSVELNDKTPLEVSKLINLNHMVADSKVGSVKLMNQKGDPAEDHVLFNLLGYDSKICFSGRGPLEAANLNLDLESNEVPFSMNFITESNGEFVDRTGGRIRSKEAKTLINFLNKKISSDFVRFFSGEGFQHVAVIKDAQGAEALSANTKSPELMEGKKIESGLPKGPGEELLKKLMYDARLLLQDHEINQVRVDLGENPSNMIWLWGQGKEASIEKFSIKNNLSGSLISDANYAKGFARIAGLTVLDFQSKEELEEEFQQVSRLLFEELVEKDFVCCYLRGCDEASLDGDVRKKISILEACDYFLLARVREYLESHPDTRVLFTSGYSHPWESRAREKEAIPFLIAGKDVSSNGISAFSELAAKSSELKFDSGTELFENFLRI
jgi:2,3-bisphosphoglycerate-independent phosphoglycerate mutase